MKPWSTAVCIAMALSGCAPGPYAIVSGRVGASPPFDTSGVLISGVDGRLYFDGELERRLDPGFHALQVTTTRKPTSSAMSATLAAPTSASVYLMAKPCMRYQVVAKYESGIAEAKWAPEVVSADPIEGCGAQEATP